MSPKMTHVFHVCSLILGSVVSAQAANCYQYNSNSGTFYATYCNGTCTGPKGSQYCEDEGNGLIIGGSAGGAAGLGIFVAIVYFCYKYCCGSKSQ